MTIFSELNETEKQALLYQSACNYLSRREHSRFELKTKLKRKHKEAENEEIDNVLDFLVAKNFQSDTRFLCDFVEDSVRKGHGPNKIKFKLKAKNVDLSEFDKELRKYNFLESAKNLFERKYALRIAKLENPSFEERQKLRASIQSFFVSRGFQGDTIQKILKDGLG